MWIIFTYYFFTFTNWNCNCVPSTIQLYFRLHLQETKGQHGIWSRIFVILTHLRPWIHKKKPYTYYKRKFWVYDKLRLEKYTFRKVNRYDMCVCNARIILISFSWPSAVIVQLLKCELSVHMSLIFRAWRDQDLMKRKIETKRVENLGGWEIIQDTCSDQPFKVRCWVRFV